MFLIPAFGSLGQEDPEFKGSQSYVARSYNISNKKEKKKGKKKMFLSDPHERARLSGGFLAVIIFDPYRCPVRTTGT